MDVIKFITQRLSETFLRDFLSQHSSDYTVNLDHIIKELAKVQVYMKGNGFHEHPQDEKQVLIEGLRFTIVKVSKFTSKFPIQDSDADKFTDDKLFEEWTEVLNFLGGIVMACEMLKGNNNNNNRTDDDDFGLEEFGDEDFLDINNVIGEDHVMLEDKQSIKIFLLKAFPILRDREESFDRREFFKELSNELGVLLLKICNACHGSGESLVLMGSLMSLKPKIYNVWKKVRDDLNDFIDTEDRPANIVRYCYEDLLYLLKPCFLYLACYPEKDEIEARALIHIWIAEGFVSAEAGCTLEETAYEYLEQLVQRSLIEVTRRSFLGTIKHFHINPLLHKFASEQSKKEGFLVANPDEKSSESLFRISIHGKNNNNQLKELNNNHLHSFLAFDFQRNILKNPKYLEVLELRRSAIHDIALQNMTMLRYLGLRYTNISSLPENINAMQHLQTLDVRNTFVQSLPESLWNIPELRNVYTDPNIPGIKGPLITARTSTLQTLKTVAIPPSWTKQIPRSLITVKKLGVCNPDNLDCRSISSILRHLITLNSLKIISDSLSSEFVDTRASPYLRNIKSVFLEGRWNCRNLLLDNINFPPNLTKLTLIFSGLKEDPMRVLGKLKAIKFLSLRKGAYTGVKMTCFAGGFPELMCLEIVELENLGEWVVEESAMPKLETVKVVRCDKLIDLPRLRVNVRREA